jgi:hypothetical protein
MEDEPAGEIQGQGTKKTMALEKDTKPGYLVQGACDGWLQTRIPSACRRPFLHCRLASPSRIPLENKRLISGDIDWEF